MKKSIIYAGVILAATISLTNCTKEVNAPETNLPEGIPFEIIASSSDTKTTVEGLSTKWAAGDAINVFHAAAGTTTYTSDNQFTIAAADLASGRFTGSLYAALADGAYDWYAFYPYSQHIKSPANTSTGYSYIGSRSDKSQAQNGVDNMSHLSGDNYPLYGKSVSSVNASDAPAIRMKPAFSILKINVKNTSGKALAVSDIKFTAPEAIIGTFYIDFSGDEATYTAASYVSNTASLSVSNADLAPEASASFYLAVKPFTANSGSKLKLSVNGYEKEIPLSKTLAFTAGHIKTLSFDVDKEIVDYIELPWIEDFSGDLSKYTLTNGDTATKIYEESSAGGTSPELLISKKGGSLSAKIKATAGEYSLTFKSNHPDYLNITVVPNDIELTKVSDQEYRLEIPENLDFFTLSITNNYSSNSRIDDIALVSDNRVALSAPANLLAALATESTNTIEVVWDAVENAGSYVVSATPEGGESLIQEVTETTCSFKDLKYKTSYEISVYAKPADITSYLNSDVVVFEDLVVTGSSPYGETKTIEINVSNSGVSGSSYASKTFVVDGITFGYTDWMKSTNIQAKKSTTNSCYNSDPIPGEIVSITVYQTGTSRAVKLYGGNSAKPTTAIKQPSTSSTMVFDFAGKGYQYFSLSTPSNACYFSKIEIVYSVSDAQ